MCGMCTHVPCHHTGVLTSPSLPSKQVSESSPLTSLAQLNGAPREQPQRKSAEVLPGFSGFTVESALGGLAEGKLQVGAQGCMVAGLQICMATWQHGPYHAAFYVEVHGSCLDGP